VTFEYGKTRPGNLKKKARTALSKQYEKGDSRGNLKMLTQGVGVHKNRKNTNKLLYLGLLN